MQQRKADVTWEQATCGCNRARRMCLAIVVLLTCLAGGCAHYEYRPDFKVEDWDFYALDKVGLDKIDPDGEITTVVFGIESGDWVSHSYKIERCDESRDWTPIKRKQS